MDYIQNEEVVAEGRWETTEPKTLVNGLPLRPNAINVYVAKVVNPKAYVWRPTVGKTAMENYLKCFVAWPANSVMFESNTQNAPHLQQSVSSTSKTQKSPLSAASSAKQPAASSKDKSRNEESPLTPLAPTNKPATTPKKKSPVTPTSPLRRSEVI